MSGRPSHPAIENVRKLINSSKSREKVIEAYERSRQPVQPCEAVNYPWGYPYKGGYPLGGA